MMPDGRALCISIHDVAPATWPQCRQLIAALRDVGHCPLGLLLVPRWHGHRLIDDARFLNELQQLLDDGCGHEVLLHGLYHVDDARAPTSPVGWLRRRILTQREGEFAALGKSDALAKIRAGLRELQCCGVRGMQVSGFVPPAWLMSPGARLAIAEQGSQLGLRYASLFTGLLDLQQGCFARAPALVYSARWRAGDALVRGAVGVIAALGSGSPLLRIGLHPSDLRRPANLRHAQRLVERALRERVPLTEGCWLQNHMGKFVACRQEKT